MSQDRREFLERIASGAMLASFPASIDVLSALRAGAPATPAEEFDLTWTNRVTGGGKYRAVFDVPEIDSSVSVVTVEASVDHVVPFHRYEAPFAPTT